MKLSPPASSSDLEIAREVARRLNQHRRRDDRPRGSAPPALGEPAAAASPRRLSPPPLPPREAAPRAEVELAPAARVEESAIRPEPASRPGPSRQAPPRDEPPPPPSEPSAGFEQSFELPQTEASVPDVDTWNPSDLSPEDDVEIETDLDMNEPEEEPLEALADASPFAAPPSADAVLEDDGLSPEQLVGAGPEASPLDELAGSEASPFDDAVVDDAAAEEPAEPSWDEVVESCRIVAQATGAMLIDPAGQVFAARGNWPTPPGPEAIATRLVAKMEAELKNAPMRSISAPFMGMHLTAWRVSLHEGLVTVAFIGHVAVRPDVRSAIDGEIHRGTGA